MNKTIGELLAASKESMVASHKKVVADLPEPDLRNEGFFLGVAYAASKFKEVSDYCIIGSGCVVSPEGLEAAAKAIQLGGWTWAEVDEASRESCRTAARKSFEAVGIACAGLVLTANAECGEIIICGSTGKLGRTPLLPGDKLYIVRATVTGCDKED